MIKIQYIFQDGDELPHCLRIERPETMSQYNYNVLVSKCAGKIHDIMGIGGMGVNSKWFLFYTDSRIRFRDKADAMHIKLILAGLSEADLD